MSSGVSFSEFEPRLERKILGRPGFDSQTYLPPPATCHASLPAQNRLVPGSIGHRNTLWAGTKMCARYVCNTAQQKIDLWRPGGRGRVLKVYVMIAVQAGGGKLAGRGVIVSLALRPAAPCCALLRPAALCPLPSALCPLLSARCSLLSASVRSGARSESVHHDRGAGGYSTWPGRRRVCGRARSTSAGAQRPGHRIRQAWRHYPPAS